MPVADEVGWLQRHDWVDCRMFQRFAERGHYGGRTEPSNTRQGLYAVAPSGEFLASVNTRDPRKVAAMMQEALDAWEKMPDAQRWLPEGQERALTRVRRWRDTYPADGLVLAVNLRDTGGEPRNHWHDHAWGRDFAWFTAPEARAFLPRRPAAGDRHRVPVTLVDRLARFHLLDTVRGQTVPFDDEDVKLAHLLAEVVRIDGDRVHLELAGETWAETRGHWPVAGFEDREDVREQVRGFRTQLAGTAVFDLETNRFVAFELVGSAKRWGGTQFNGRRGDLEAAPVGVVLRLAEPADGRTPPAFIGKYSWK